MTVPWQQRPVGVVGLGLIGGSLGLDLQAAGVRVHGLVNRTATAKRAGELGLATRVSLDPAVLADCSLVVLALPLDRLLHPAPSLLAALPQRAVVTDVGSVKTSVLARWRHRHGFVASHPMAGTARSGVEAGQLRLFAGRPWVATPDEHTDPLALQVVRQLAELVGARWMSCDAAAHDRAVALISHLPVLVSAALLEAADQAARTSEDKELPALVRSLASSGFSDTTRVGGGNPELGTLMARCNQKAVLEGLASYRKTITELEEMVKLEDWDALQQALVRCERLRPHFL